MPRLYVLTGPDIGKSFALEAGATLGRAAECGVHLRDVSVSRHHARFEFTDGRWSIVDTDSRNGLVVGGLRVPSAELHDGSEFALGEVLLRFRADSAVAAGAAPPAEKMAQAAGPARREPSPSDELRNQLARTDLVRARAPEGAASPPPRAPRSEEEIVLEGDWDGERAPEKPAVAPPSSAASRSSAGTAASVAPPSSASSEASAAPAARASSGSSAWTPAPARAAPGSAAPAAPRAPSQPSTAPPRVSAPVPIGSPRAGGITQTGKGVLQYNKVADRPGFFSADLSQQPWWVRLGVYLLALVVFAVLLYATFKGTSFFKEKAHGLETDAPIEEPR